MSDWTKMRDGFTHYVVPIGAGIATGLLATPMAGVAVGGSLLAAGQAHDAMKSQKEANDLNWQHQKELTALAFNHDLEMADYNNEWNSYANQAKLMQSAGLNPAVMFGEGNLTNGSNAGASGIPTPTPMSPLFDSDLINAQNNMVSNLIDAGVSVAKTPKELAKMDAEIQDLLANARNKDAATAYQELQTQLDQVFAGLERQKGIDKIAADIKYTIAKEMLTLKEGELVDEQKVNTWMDTLLKRSQKLLNEQNYKMLVEQAPVILQNLIKTGKQIEATTNNLNSNTAYTNTLNRLEPAKVSAIIKNLDSQTLSNLASAAYTNAMKKGQDITNMSLPDVIAGNLDEQEMRTITGYDIADYDTHKSSSSSGAKIGPISWNSSEQSSTPNRNSRVRVGDTYGVTKQRIKQRGYRRHRSYGKK